jgi:transcriptional regulator with XRE-family HTH domain
MDPATSTLGPTMRARRLELRLSSAEAAARARVPETSWKLIEQGQQAPSDLMLGAICRALEWTSATVDDLLRNDNEVGRDGERVVDLDAHAEEPQPEITLDTRGLTPAQLREVQGYIDYLRERFS